MSKKKATMTLKDFHGGSIPSDLPLPSAPGIMVRPSDRGGYDRQASWGNPMGRSDHRLRPGSAGTARNFDDKTPFLSHGTHIGRNFDEDERKPLDGTSGPRRTVSDESLRALPSRVVEPKIQYSAAGRVTSRPASTPSSQYSSSTGSSSYAGRFTDVNNVGASAQGFVRSSGVGLNSQNMVRPSGQVISGPYPNAWGVRKEAAGVKEPASTACSAPDAATKLAHASALEKVSSGRWHSKQQIIPQIDVEAIRYPETESEFHFRESNVYSKNVYTCHNSIGRMDYHDVALVKQAEKSLNIDDGIRGSSKEIPTYERVRPPMLADTNGRNPSNNINGFHPPHSLGKPTVSELHLTIPSSESSERPKLKLHPRSKPVENLEPPMDYKQVYHQPSTPAHAENHSESNGIKNHMNGEFVGSESGNPIVGRPKLNLKPRTEPFEQFEGDTESKRNTLFGGARPRELVLKERGIDTVAMETEELVQPPYRSKQDTTKTERVSSHATAQYNDKPENIPIEHRTSKNSDRRDHRLDVERTDAQRRNWQSENWKNRREFDKHHQPRQQQQLQERPPSPESWRKPVDPKSASPEASGLRYGKTASAVALAQAFSKSISDPAAADRFSGQRGLLSRGQVLFSRLIGPTPRPQINGY